MTIDINELRRLAQAATPGPDGVSLNWLKLLQDFQKEANPAAISELLDRLEAAEKVRDWNAERLEDAIEELKALRAKIEQMERQEPVKYEKRIKLRSKHTWGAWWECDKNAYVKAKAAGGHYPKFSDDLLDYEMRPLYALPGAQNVPKEAIAKILTDVMNIAVANGADSRSMPDEYVEVAAWLCGIPGAQPTPSINPAALSPVINWLRNGCDPMKAADELERLAAAIDPPASVTHNVEIAGD